MFIMQGDDSGYWAIWAVVLSVLSVLFVWYMVITGRDHKPKTQARGEHEIERFGELEQDHAPLSKFLILTYVGIGVWVVIYVVWTGIEGLI
jgi:hypothetical protein